MEFHVSLSRRGHLAADTYTALREAILAGTVRPGDRLPPTRGLAARLGVSRNTVLDAYDRLVAEGFLVGKVGAGTFVADSLAGVEARRPKRGDRAAVAAALRPRADRARGLATAPPLPPVPYDFQIGAPDPALFPWDAWRWHLGRQLRGRRHRPLSAPPEGDPGLRIALARHLGQARGVRASPDDVVVTCGAQQAFDLVARVMLRPGDVVAVEDPGYPPARALFAAHGAKVVRVPVDRAGLDVARLPRAARLVYVTPSHQFPLGVPMELSRRLALLAWARRTRAAVIEDDYDSELRHAGRPLDALHALDRDGRVIYVGTFAKVLLPSLRVGYLVAPPALVPALHAARALADGHGALDVQRALAAYMDDGLLARHIRRLRRIYGERRTRLAAALDREFADRDGRPQIERLPAVAGLHQSLVLRGRRVDPAALAARALAAGVRVEPLSRYGGGRRLPGLALGFGLVPTERIDAGIARLAALLR